jgi:hypothetical protein
VSGFGSTSGYRPVFGRRTVADVLAVAVLDVGWPVAVAVPALLALAADPATRSPARLSCAGPWWDTPPRTGGLDGPDGRGPGGVADLEALLAETGGLRVALQRQARAELAGGGGAVDPVLGHPASSGDPSPFRRRRRVCYRECVVRRVSVGAPLEVSPVGVDREATNVVMARRSAVEDLDTEAVAERRAVLTGKSWAAADRHAV